MRALIQRVQSASVSVEKEVKGEITKGLLVLLGLAPDENKEDFEYISKKIRELRIFNDEDGVMNLSLEEVKGEVLLISQFTLHAKTRKGKRPSYIRAAKPDQAESLYQDFLKQFKRDYQGKVESGIFGADMQVELVNDGPVTLMIDSKNKDL